MPALTRFAAGLALALCLSGPVAAQSLSPMLKEGTTPTDTKGFKVSVGNPYPRRMTFLAIPMDKQLMGPAEGAMAQPRRITLAPGQNRAVIVAFKIDPVEKERTIALCIQPEAIDGPILPRVCGFYTGRIIGHGG